MQDNSSNTLSIWDRAEQIRWAMRWPAMTVMLFTRWDIGYRMLSPIGIGGVFLVLVLISANTRPVNRPQDMEIFAWAMLAAGLTQRFLRWREMGKCAKSHSYYIGTSFIQRFARTRWLRSERRTARYIEPLFVAAIGLGVLRFSHVLGIWLLFSGFALRVFEDAVYKKELHRKLDMADDLVEAESQTAYVEQSETPAQSRGKTFKAGIPTGLGDDISKINNKR